MTDNDILNKSTDKNFDPVLGRLINGVQKAATAPKIVRIHEVVAMTGLSAATIWRLIDGSMFPPPIKLSLRSVGWVEAEAQAWLQACIHNSRSDIGIDLQELIQAIRNIQ